MKTISFIGAVIVTLSLIFYSIGVIKEQKKHKIVKSVLFFISIGIVFDITATICMIMGSSNTPFTIHGFLGYSALLVMIVDAYLIWKSYLKKGSQQKVPKILHSYTLIAYLWWVLAYINGSLLVVLK